VGGKSKQHVIPKFYLRRFSGKIEGRDGDFVKIYNINTGRVTTSNIKSASVSADFYTLPDESEDKYVTEDTFSKIESLSADVLEKISKGIWPLVGQDRIVLGLFAAMLYLRGHSGRDLLLKAQDRVRRSSFDDLKNHYVKSYGIVLTEDQYIDIQDELSDEVLGEAGKVAKVHSGVIWENINSIAAYFICRPMVVENFSSPVLIVGDEPVGFSENPIMMYGPQVSPMISLPLDDRTAIIFGPLSGRSVTLGGLEDKSIEGNQNSAAFLNSVTSQFSSCQLFCAPGMESIFYDIDREFLEDRMEVRRGILD